MLNDSSSKFFTEENSSLQIKEDDFVKYYKFNGCDTIEALIMSKEIKHNNNWVRLNKNEMVNKETGEIKKMRTNANRGNNLNGIKRTQKGIYRLILYNFPLNVQTLHFVLTYATPMYNWKNAYKDFVYFRSKLKHKYKWLEYLLQFLSLPLKVQYIYIYL